jgi:hypothetical protein
MKRLLGENASSGLKSANGPRPCSGPRWAVVSARGGRRTIRGKLIARLAFVAQDSQFLLEIDVRVEKYDPM